MTLLVGPGPQVAQLFVEARRSPTLNELWVSSLGLPALRRVRIVFHPSTHTNQIEQPEQWVASARAICQFPETDLSPVGGQVRGTFNEVHAAPSLVAIPPPGDGVMAAFDLFLPDTPRVLAAVI